MQFYSIREYSQKVRVTLSRKFLILFSLTVWPNSLTTSLGIFPNTVKLHNSEWVKTTVNRGLNILAYKPHWSGTSLLEAPKYCRQPPQAKVSNCRLELKPTLIEGEVCAYEIINYSNFFRTVNALLWKNDNKKGTCLNSGSWRLE